MDNKRMITLVHRCFLASMMMLSICLMPKTIEATGNIKTSRPALVTINDTTKTVEGSLSKQKGKIKQPLPLEKRNISQEKEIKSEKQKTNQHKEKNAIVEPHIRVYLKSVSNSLLVKAGETVFLQTVNSKVSKRASVKDPLHIEKKGHGIYVNGHFMGEEILITPTGSKQSNILSVDNQRYSGNIRLIYQKNNQQIIVVNELPLEEYLYGVVPSEVVPSWSQPALQAQAVAARSYALYHMNANKKKLYDVGANTGSQLYKGKAAELESTNRAVDTTRGVVMLYNNSVISAVFHSDGGGYTESSANVWGGELPYLQSVEDVSRHPGTYMWQIKTTREELEKSLHKAGIDVGKLKEIKLSPLQKRPMKVQDRTMAGRIKEMTLIGTKGKKIVDGATLRTVLQLRSTLFDIFVDYEPKHNLVESMQSKTWHKFGMGNQVVYIKGYGWGHGVGLSQWGAQAMAEKAPHDKKQFEKILKHYYKGIEIKKLY